LLQKYQQIQSMLLKARKKIIHRVLNKNISGEKELKKPLFHVKTVEI